MAGSTCTADRALLGVIDIQERLGQAMPGKVLNRVVQNSQLLIRSATELSIPVVLSEQYPQGLGSTIPSVSQCLPADHGSVAKTSFSCATVAGFNDLVAQSGRSEIVLLGMEAHICVLQTAIGLISQGLTVFVVEDAICSRRLENYQNALDRLRQSGANVVSAESVVFEWLADSSHPSFKTIQSMLR